MTAPSPFPSTDPEVDPDDLEGIYRQLVQGLGRELVTEHNAEALARRADIDGHTVLATELREWKASC
ncbi:hypothetical protein LZ017_13865 [Pelomonas sp. CA6]|uniref:hypothetical protein n=1 Tax=Pelomonas sp. CA6 TaxID=2907999 RepID=UPI001F4BFE75|nr:hypothetical protein [Pelomonas sp. CA6]MCH7344466.1 hypothetical protein [Pelomonas sp. CA6]